jgi:hypothetical protein
MAAKLLFTRRWRCDPSSTGSASPLRKLVGLPPRAAAVRATIVLWDDLVAYRFPSKVV